MVFQEGKKQKNLENFFVNKKKPIFNGIQNSLFVYILKFSHKYSFNVTFDLSRRLKMFSSSSNVCDKKKRSSFLILLLSLNFPVSYIDFK